MDTLDTLDLVKSFVLFAHQALALPSAAPRVFAPDVREEPQTQALALPAGAPNLQRDLVIVDVNTPMVSEVPDVCDVHQVTQVSSPEASTHLAVPCPWQGLPRSLRSLMMVGLDKLDTWKFMQGILSNQNLPKGLRVTFMDARVTEALRAELPSASPFWILFGFDAERGVWGSSTPTYDFSQMLGAKAVQADCQKLHQAGREATKKAAARSWCPEGQKAMLAILTCLEMLASMDRDGEPTPVFPCFPIVMWGHMLDKACTAYPVTTASGITQNWAVPNAVTKDAFFDVARDFVKAVWHIFQVLEFIEVPEARAPELDMALVRMPMNHAAANFAKFQNFVAKVELTYVLDDAWGYGGMLPFWKSDVIMLTEGLEEMQRDEEGGGDLVNLFMRTPDVMVHDVNGVYGVPGVSDKTFYVQATMQIRLQLTQQLPG